MTQKWDTSARYNDMYRVKENAWECAMVRVKQKEKKMPEPTMEEPSLERLTTWWESGYCLATDGCELRGTPSEREGICEHGHRSWLMYLDMCDQKKSGRPVNG